MVAADDTLESEEMLAMLYSMAIMRLVNGFVENPQKKTGYSISELAEAVGIPRVLVDIRHESSHRSLPSLRLLRLAAIKAFDWLKCIYWDSQSNAIPDVQVELSSKLHDINHFLSGKDSVKAKSGSKRKRSEKMISRNTKYVRRLYYACPSEVASIILDFFQLDAPESSENSDVQQTDSLDVDQSSGIHNQISNNDMKTIVTKLSEKEPRLLLGILKSVIETIETCESLEYKGESNACLPAKMENLCSLLLWLVTKVKELKDSGCIGLVHEIGVLSSDRNAVPRFCLAKLLQKLLVLSIIGDRRIIDAALLLIDMTTNNVKEKLLKLPALSLGRLARDSTLPESRKEIESVDKATEKLEMFKSQLKQKDICSVENGTGGSLHTIIPEKRNRWSTAKSWTPCPIGMIPCSFSSVPVLPNLDVAVHEDDTLEEHVNFEPDDHPEIIEHYSHAEKQLDAEIITEISKTSPECEISEMPELAFPLKGRLLVGGVWKVVSKEELLSIKSKMKILL
uniref:Las1-like family protein n=2 Tax=Oryza brachyantha TaxID=4533 RepID=J3NBZ3_ORYBR